MEQDVLPLHEKFRKTDSPGDVLTLPLYLIAFLFELSEDKSYIFSIFVSPAASIMPNGNYIAGAVLVQLFPMEELQNILIYN